MQKVVQGLRGISRMGWQTCVDGVGNLIEVVADPPQLCEQRRVDPVDGDLRDFDFAFEDHALTESCKLEFGAARIRKQARVRLIRNAEVDLPLTLLRRVRVGAGHVSPHQAWVRGVGTTS